MYRSLTLSCSLTCISLVCFARFVLNLNYTWRACKCFRQRIARCLSLYIRFAWTAIRRPCMNFQQNEQLSLALCSCVCTQFRHKYMCVYVCVCAVSKQAACGCCYSCRLGWAVGGLKETTGTAKRKGEPCMWRKWKFSLTQGCFVVVVAALNGALISFCTK